MLNQLALLHKATAERHWENICSLNGEVGGLSYDKQQLQAEVLKLRKEVSRLSTDNRDLRYKIEDLTAE